ncbi:MAG: hypothetical protein MR629_01175 [Helicobacter sp.]|nr:hypothetical protein [Helicobacter sp.]MDD7567786.1 hypothetical protein [Helicobacter sp.]MDY5741093.1 hypothetical protein [Helicobacter sp.]
MNGFYENTHAQNNVGFHTTSNKGFNEFNLGILIEAKQEGKYPSLLIGASTDAVENIYLSKTQNKLQYFRDYSFFLTNFYTIDPLVFLLQTNYRLSLEKSLENQRIKSGDIFIFAPTIYFAINPFVSINFGFKYQYNAHDKVNNEVVAYNASSFAYTFGIGYEINYHLLLFADIESLNTNQYTSNTFSLNISYRI